ncbi:MAG: DUF6483 family protein [Clostridium sp.]
MLAREGNTDTINFENFGNSSMLYIMVQKYLNQGDYAKAEDMIFQELETTNVQEVYEIAEDFYNELLKKSDDDLEKGNFSREEIYLGLEDLKRKRN